MKMADADEYLEVARDFRWQIENLDGTMPALVPQLAALLRRCAEEAQKEVHDYLSSPRYRKRSHAEIAAAMKEERKYA